MNKSFPIGIFDSGVGGLSVLQRIHSKLPNESLVYVADSINAPYGAKDDSFILDRSISIVDFLVVNHQIKLLVIACNTATASSIGKLREIYDFPIIGMEPAIKPANEASKSKKVGILATEGTIKSSKFSALLDSHSGETQFFTQPCIGLVELIEQGKVESHEVISLLNKNLIPLLEHNVDVVVLGCTHYIFIKKNVENFFNSEITIIETGEAVAMQTQRILKEFNLESDNLVVQHTIYSNSKNSHMNSIVRSLLADFDFLYDFQSNWY
tara:strand:- start:1475 stop:2278 length:804 start_codon:yes stop_codon:yes gene_type:complete